MQCQLLAPSGWTAMSLQGLVDRPVEVGPQRTIEVTHLDTFDWRVFHAGAVLSLETERRRRTILWIADDNTLPYVLPIVGDLRFVVGLPDGYLKSTLTSIVGRRALLTMGARRVTRRHHRVVDAEGNASVRLVLERSTVVEESGAPAGEPITSVSVVGGPGHEAVFDEVVKQLRSAGAVTVSKEHDLATAAAARNRTPGDYSSKIAIALGRSQRADEALQAILSHLLAILRANVDGVLDDVDTEFLHDLRVASRRARSAIAQVKGVFDRGATDAFQAELKWLGNATNPCRDLDVFLLEMERFRGQLGGPASDLDPLLRTLERDRTNALEKVRRALRSPRFSRLIESWEELASSPPESKPPNAARPIVEVAGERIFKAYRRMIKRGSELGEDPPPEQLHRLRIDGKKLRYLLEFFASLYEPINVTRLVKELKRLQDILGGFNDMTVQQARLLEFAEELMASGEARPETVLAMGRLAAAMARRQDELYQGFSSAFAAFASPSSQQRYCSLFSGGER